MPELLRIVGGRVYDPANGVDGAARDVFILDGKIVAEPPPDIASLSVRTINARGMVVMPGGVDIHCHIASSAVNRARAVQGEEHATHVHVPDPRHHLRAGTGHLTPSTHITGYRYAAMGYTTAIDAAVAPSGARHTQLELEDTPNLDVGYLLLVANHAQVIELLDRGEDDAAAAFIAQLLHETGAFGIKVVNPGGVAAWRADPTQQTIETLDDSVAGTTVTPRRILETAVLAAERAKLPHPAHVHCNRLGLPGNVGITLETLRAVQGRRVHLTHLQFHAYGQSKKGRTTSEAQRLIDYINGHPGVTADVGQVMFGDAVTLTGDTPLEHLLWRLTGKRYVSIESELEAGCGVMPIRYDRGYLHSLQWAIGLELMLGAADPTRMLLSTDHPNGGAFLSYPTIIACLMSKALRDEMAAKANPQAIRRTGLADFDRQYSLGEIAALTRWGPAKALGLTRKGQLGPGADGDVTVYHDRPDDPRAMFESPRYVIKAGRVLVEDGELREPVAGQHFRSDVPSNDSGRRALEQWFDARGSYDISQFGLTPGQREAMRTVEGMSDM